MEDMNQAEWGLRRSLSRDLNTVIEKPHSILKNPEGFSWNLSMVLADSLEVE